jgi:hypothetical protein
MARQHDTRDQEVFQEHPIVKELLEELQEIDDKARVEVRLCEVMN